MLLHPEIQICIKNDSTEPVYYNYMTDAAFGKYDEKVPSSFVENLVEPGTSELVKMDDNYFMLELRDWMHYRIKEFDSRECGGTCFVATITGDKIKQYFTTFGTMTTLLNKSSKIIYYQDHQDSFYSMKFTKLLYPGESVKVNLYYTSKCGYTVLTVRNHENRFIYEYKPTGTAMFATITVIEKDGSPIVEIDGTK